MAKKRRIAKSLEEWLKDTSLTPRWTIGEEEGQLEERRRKAWSSVLMAHEAPVPADLRAVGLS